MKKTILVLISAFAMTMGVAAQDVVLRKGDCVPAPNDTVAEARGQVPVRRLASINTSWDANRTYRQLVILLSFSDKDFKMDNPRQTYDDMLNKAGYNQRQGPGCMADYYRAQSGGLLNMQFDVYGPYKVSSKAQPNANADSNTRNYGRTQMMEATKMFLEEHPEVDFSVYDWNGNKYVNQVIFVAAGYSGNQNSKKAYGYIWPNTSTFTSIKTPDNYTITNYTVSCELWTNDASCGIGTICHEFTHSLGLPDIYPTTSSAGFSVADEWDLMDGGNFTNLGWCPPNFTPVEKMLLGWLTPTDLTEPTTVRKLKPSAEGGEVYRIKHSENEYLLLENRQQQGWDSGAPGKGLVIYHVDYDNSAWSNNTVNNNKSKRRFELVHADNLDYDDWDNRYASWYIVDRWQKQSLFMNSYYLSTSPYPWSTDSTDFVNNALTLTSVPPVKMNNANEYGDKKLDKPITNIRMSADGLISFDFMGGGESYFSGGEGTIDDPYLVSTTDDMMLIAQNVNKGESYAGTCFRVVTDQLDFNGVEYVPIGNNGSNESKPFEGRFDGNGVVVKNLAVNGAGVFGHIGTSGRVSGITLHETCRVSGVDGVGAIAGVNEGLIADCVNKASVSAAGNSVGGICGNNTGTISNCVNMGDVSGESAVGGIAGTSASDAGMGSLRNCFVSGCSISGTGNVGAICSDSGLFSENYYARDVVVVEGSNTYDGFVARGIGNGKNIVDGNGAMLKLDFNDVFAITDEGYYEIATEADLQALANIVNIVGNDCEGVTFVVTVGQLDLTEAPVAIGTYCIQDAANSYSPNIMPFAGVFEGNGVVISNNLIEDTGDDYTGYALFPYNKGTIRNVVLASNCKVAPQNSYTVGGLVAVNEGTIEGCVSQGTVIGSDLVGGIAGINNGIIEQCENQGPVTVSDTDNSAGGIAGINSNGVYRCVNTGDITGVPGPYGYDKRKNVNIGGIAGQNSGTLSNNFVAGGEFTHASGAIVGTNTGQLYSNLYAKGCSGISQGMNNGDVTVGYGAVKAFVINSGDDVSVWDYPTEGDGVFTYNGVTSFAEGLTVVLRLSLDSPEEIPYGYIPQFLCTIPGSDENLLVDNSDGTYSVTIGNDDLYVSGWLVEHPTTGISDVSHLKDKGQMNDKCGEIYDLQGRKLDGVGAGSMSARLSKGLYIVNGRKMVVK